MFTCADGHDNIVYNSGGCPVCVALEELQDVRTELENAQEALEYTQEALEDITEELDTLVETHNSMLEMARDTAPELLI